MLRAATRRLRDIELRQEHEIAVGPCPQDVQGQADWAQRKARSDVDLERILEQERILRVRSRHYGLRTGMRSCCPFLSSFVE